jgi:hypothetical protein
VKVGHRTSPHVEGADPEIVRAGDGPAQAAHRVHVRSRNPLWSRQSEATRACPVRGAVRAARRGGCVVVRALRRVLSREPDTDELINSVANNGDLPSIGSPSIV